MAARVVHVFADPAGRCEWQKYLNSGVMQSEFIPFEFGANNMYCGKSWEELFELAKQPKSVILITPPYDTFSRARHKRPGPPPLRSEQWPRGFPWLKDSSLQRVNLANHFIDQCLIATIFAAEAGSFFLWEAPEHFGRTADGNVPSSIWAWPEILDCIARCSATTFVHYLCEFGAEAAKPTRYLCNLPFFVHSPRPYMGLPVLDANHRYLGPLPAACPHVHHPVSTGKSTSADKWNLSQVAPWPERLCQFLAAAFDFSLQADGETRRPSKPKANLADLNPRSGSSPSDPHSRGNPVISDPSGSSSLDPHFRGNQVISDPSGSSSLDPHSRGNPAISDSSSSDPHSHGNPVISGSGSSSSDPHSHGNPVISGSSSLDPHSRGGPAISGSSSRDPPFPSNTAISGSSSHDPHTRGDPEAAAEGLLALQGPLETHHIRHLFSFMPREAPPRDTAATPEPGSSFTTGAYCKGGLVGLRHHTSALPKTTRVLTTFLQQVEPGFRATAIAIFDNVRTVVHRDSRNEHLPNLVVPLSDFQNGEIWVEQEDGDVWETTPAGPRPGVLLEVSQGPVKFDAWRDFHSTRPWSGRRLVLVAYTTAKLDSLSTSDRIRLKELGFLLPLGLDASNSETSEAVVAQMNVTAGTTGAPVSFKPEACGNRGNPIRVEWEGQEDTITDGFGLCSPARWPPMNRGHRLKPPATAHALSMYGMLVGFIAEHVPEPRRFCLSLLGGKVESSPFAGEKLDRLRQQWADTLGAGPEALEIPAAQPFLLKALSLSAERLEDPDWEILTEGVDCFCTGVPLGFNYDIPHLPQVYERKVHWRKLDESELELDRKNYKSAESSSAGLLEKFRAEEKLGRMVPTTMGALRAEYDSDMIRVASMGAISKPDGSVRPLHDATHGVRVNNQIRLVNQVAVPGPAEMAFSVRQSGAMQEVPLAATADVSAAHRLVLHRRKDWALMACRAEQNSNTVWINKVGTFGLSPASFWWSRLYGIIGRVVARCLLQHAFYHFAYVDDVHPTFYGKRMYINFLVWLILQEMIGVPFAYHKFKGKTLVAFIGYELDYGSRLVGLSEARGAWVRNWVEEARKARFVVSVRKFAEFLGRLGFVARVVYWIKPHLAPLYAWAAAASKSHVAKMPDTVVLTLVYLETTLNDVNFKVAPGRVSEEGGLLFHTDAKCADGLVVLGGWDSRKDPSEAPWFAITVKPADAPYLFDGNEKSQWASASAELLAALWVFGHLKESSVQRRLPVAVAGATDNQSNEKLLKRQSTTKWPLMLINMQLSHLLRKACLRLSLSWKPREENQLADALTNLDFQAFSSGHRVNCGFSELPLELLNQLWASKSSFDASRKALQSASSFQPRVAKRKAEGTPW